MINNSLVTVLHFGYFFTTILKRVFGKWEKYSSEGNSSFKFLELLLHENLPYCDHDKRNLAENNLSKLVRIL